MLPREAPGRGSGAAAPRLLGGGPGAEDWPRTQASESPFAAPLPSGTATPGAARQQPGPSEVPRQTRDHRGAARAPTLAAELPPCSARRTPAPRAEGPIRPHRIPAGVAQPQPGQFPSSTAATRRRRGCRSRGLPARWIPGPLGGTLGAGERGPQTQNFVALGTAQSSLPRGAGGAAATVTQLLARWRAGPCNRPPARAPGPPALSSRLCVFGCREKLAAVSQACTPVGKARSSRVVSSRKKCNRSCFPAGVESGVGVQGLQRAGVPGETHPTHKQSG